MKPNTYKKEATDLIYGIHPVMEAMMSGRNLHKIWIGKYINPESKQELRKLAHTHNVPFQYVPVEKLNRLSRKNHQGVIAQTSVAEYTLLADVLPGIYEAGEVPLFVYLDEVSDVRNFGAIARSAECFGAHALIIPMHGNASANADALKASAGALSRVNICREPDINEMLNFAKQSGLQIIACTEKAKKPVSKADLTVPSIILLGSEDQGISKEVLVHADIEANIPLKGEINSLNVSVAAGIILYEADRQRNI